MTVSNDRVVATIQKNRNEEIRVELSAFNGRGLANLRVWFQPSDGGDMRPGKAGFALKIEQLPELIEALLTAEAEAVRRGFLAEKSEAGP